ncbi:MULTISPECIES: Uma2 family endonuclease [Nostocales]|uniref:Uma2 family endonuclease n=3 Tax=Nostocales TaxID=1161 RepID=A0A0C1NE11_9CYAN|nr:Uma2 family endonuclease [Tolypothrix bouteillei]KAF3887042.1 Uma2 family endonuclease [Tolypothrix bouteillei VB521301]
MQSATTYPVRWTTYDLEIFEGDRVNRYEIIDGELFVTRAPDWKHQAVCINIGTVLKLWSDESGLGQPAVTPGIVFSESDNVIPDIVWVSQERLERLLDEAGHLTAAPELVVEVLSPGKANERRDREAKLKLYSVQGVHEYWIVNLKDQTVEIYRRQNAVLKLIVTLYQQDELTSPILPGFSCLVSKFF